MNGERESLSVVFRVGDASKIRQDEILQANLLAEARQSAMRQLGDKSVKFSAAQPLIFSFDSYMGASTALEFSEAHEQYSPEPATRPVADPFEI